MKQFGWGVLGASVACVAMVQPIEAETKAKTRKLSDEQERELYKSRDRVDRLTNGQYGIYRDNLEKWKKKIEDTEDEQRIEKFIKKIFQFSYVFYTKLGQGELTAEMPALIRMFVLVDPHDLEGEEQTKKIQEYLDEAKAWAAGDVQLTKVYVKAEEAARDALKFAPKGQEAEDKKGLKDGAKKKQKEKPVDDQKDKEKKSEEDKKGKKEKKEEKSEKNKKDKKEKKDENDKSDKKEEENNKKESND